MAKQGSNGKGRALKIRPSSSLVSRTIVHSPVTGWDYRIQKLNTIEIIGSFGAILDLIGMTVRAERSKKRKAEARAKRDEKILSSPKQQAEIERIMDTVIRTGLVEPKIPKEESIWSLGTAEAFFLFQAICEFSGATPTAGEPLVPLSEVTRASLRSSDSRQPSAGGRRAISEKGSRSSRRSRSTSGSSKPESVN